MSSPPTADRKPGPPFAQFAPDTDKKLTSSYIADLKADESCPILKQIYYSSVYKYFYLLLLVVTLFLAVWIILDYSNLHRTAFLRKPISSREHNAARLRGVNQPAGAVRHPHAHQALRLPHPRGHHDNTVRHRCCCLVDLA